MNKLPVNNTFPFIVKNDSKAIISISKPIQTVIKVVNGKLVEEPAGEWIIHVRDAE